MQFFTVRFIGSISAAGGRRAYFNFRSSARGDGWWARYAYHYTISIHAPPRGATPHARRNGRIDGLFQFTPLREGRRGGIVRLQSGNQFQFTPLREGRRTLEFQLVCQIHFNSRPSARGDVQGEGWHDRANCISIHAPPRGATALPPPPSPTSADFNSRPSARGDCTKWAFTSNSDYFNSRPSARGDAGRWQLMVDANQFQFTPLREGRLFRLQRDYHGALISIHAPPRGATIVKPIKGSTEKFQFTPLREGRPAQCRDVSRQFYFNSRPSARGDFANSAGQGSGIGFQFTPLREGRPINSLPVCAAFFISIHAPPRGATQPRNRQARCSAHFNSRPSARGDRFARQRGQALHISIHAPPRGATTRELK